MCKQEAAILELTQSAVAAFRRVIAETGDHDILGIRIAASGGCSGTEYQLGLEAQARDGDAVIHFEDVMVFVDEESKSALAGVEVDFCENAQATGFVFKQPSGCGSCGKRKSCGS